MEEKKSSINKCLRNVYGLKGKKRLNRWRKKIFHKQMFAECSWPERQGTTAIDGG